MGYHNSQELAPQRDIETASATTSLNNDGSWSVVGIAAIAAIAISWLLISSTAGCTAMALYGSVAGINNQTYQQHGNSDFPDEEELEKLFDLYTDESVPQNQGQGRPRA